MNNTTRSVRKIGILGGTFDPIHLAHISIASAAYKKYKLEKVLVMPSNSPPHKNNSTISNASIRSDMIKLAIKDKKEFEFSDFELKRSGIIYTAETLSLLKAENPNDIYYFILGADSLKSIDTWYKPEIIFKNAKVVVADRPTNLSKTELLDMITKIEAKYKTVINKMNLIPGDISSSKIKECIKKNKDVSSYLDPLVYSYIKENNLYL